MCEKLKKNYKTDESLLRAYRVKIIPKEGDVDNIHYSFHGVGCYFEFKDGIIDIDFGPDDRCDGFDEYRLYKYLENMLFNNKYNTIIDKQAFKRQFSELITAGIITNPQLAPSSHLYYLKDHLS